MVSESLQNSEGDKEATFQSWLIEFQGSWWLNTKVMPPDVYKAVQMYDHYLVHGRTEDDPEVQKCAKDFTDITGFDIKDFIDFRKRLESKDK